MFSAMASGGSFYSEPTASSTATSSSTPSETVTDRSSVSPFNDNDSKSKALFAEAANAIDNSGTFAMASESKVISSNLEAAVAAMTGEPKAPSEPKPRRVFKKPAFPPKQTKSIPMHSEKVVLPRPLFFGPILPPRVLKETRKIVGDALKQANGKELPPHVQNLIGSINAFGFGLSPYPSKEHVDETDPSYYTGDPYLSTYQPVWGNAERADREAKLKNKTTGKKKKGAQEQAAPPAEDSMTAPTKPDDRDMFAAWARGGDDSPAKSIPDSAAAATTTTTSPPAVQASPMNDTNLFLQHARGEVPGSPMDWPLNASLTSPLYSSLNSSLNSNMIGPSEQQSLFSKWARGGDDDSTAAPAATPATRPSDEQSLFSRLARGEDDAPPARTANEPSDEQSIFSRMARGEDDAPAAITATEPSEEQSIFSRMARGEDDAPAARTASEPSDEQSLFSRMARGEDNAPAARTANEPSDEQSLFSRMARGEDDAPAARTANEPSDEQSLFSKMARGEDDGSATETVPAARSATEPSDEQSLFSRWALGGDDTKPGGSVRELPQKAASGTLHMISAVTAEDSDDDSVVGSEMKKKVGVNEHLDAALASLTNDRPQTATMASSGSITAEEAQALLSQLGQTTPGGRPLTSLELTSGCVPLFYCDDPALPSESDLGVYETREEQVRCLEQRREQEIIEKHTMPDIFGPISCPNPALGPDDNHSSNLRTVPVRKAAMSVATGMPSRASDLFPSENPGSRRGTPVVASMATVKHSGSFVDVPGPSNLKKSTSAPQTKAESGKPPRQGSKSSSAQPIDRCGTTTRFGWWNNIDDEEEVLWPVLSDMVQDSSDEPPLIKPRTDYSTDSLLVNTRLKPTPAKLREENAPLSRLHSATSVASCLPFLSDRPPSWRYLQIDTKAIGFTALGGEIEPLFCSLAIYHVETSSMSSSEQSSAPSPNLQKCGRVTEVLHFDVVSDKDVEERCLGALWPYHDKSPETEELPESERTQGTRCGVFPVPSNLNIANLYAIIVIQKVLSEKSDTEAYTKQDDDGTPLRSTSGDREKYREKAEKASDRQGRFLMPFAFGVTPLLQVFGTDTPSVPTSRAVQIPLFQFTHGLGERQIIDHIMVMLYPRANRESGRTSGPAPNTSGGTAMLVMRYFGYLGLDSVVRNKSSLARHRLVDFTGELQIRRMGEDENSNEAPSYREAQSDRDYVVEPWGVKHASEPTALSGRNVVAIKNRRSTSSVENVDGKSKTPERPTGDSPEVPVTREGLRKSALYAQELAAVPLQVSPSIGKSIRTSLKANRGRFGMQSSDSEPYFHTTFCNELLCNPRLVHNCPKGNIVTKVELREVEWNEELDSYVARLPKDGPYLHNQRRGPVFVNEAFTSCSISTTTVSLLSEFKVKLPLLLSDPSNPLVRLALLFSVYHVEIKPKKSWTERGSKAISKQFGVMLPDSPVKKKSVLEPLGCGFLPISYNPETSCLIDNGLHDVKLCYDAKPALQGPPGTDDDQGSDDELILTRKPESYQPVDMIRETETSYQPVDMIHETETTASCSVTYDDSADGSVDERIVVDTDQVIDDATYGNTRRHARKLSTGSHLSDATSVQTSDQVFKASASAVDQMSLQVRRELTTFSFSCNYLTFPS